VFTFDVSTSEGDADLTESFDVTVTLVDPCVNPTVTLPESQTVEYTLTDLAKIFTLTPQASVQPSICQIDSETTTPVDSGIQDNVVYDKDAETITITQITDTLIPSDPNNDGSTSAEVTITTTYTTTDYNGNTVTTEVTHTVIVKNPCLDPLYVSIQAPSDFELQDYIIDSGSKNLNVHGLFTVVTQPVTGHNLCGNLSLTPKYDGASLPSADTLTQVTYESAASQFAIISTNGDLIGGSKPYSVIAKFQNYDPSVFTGVSTAEANGIINFIDPCLQPFDLTPRVTPNPASDNFSGNSITVQVLEFQVSPARCEVIYSCSEIRRQDGSTSNIDCSDITFDGTFDDAGNDGQLVI
jgi:hypothetical protein